MGGGTKTKSVPKEIPYENAFEAIFREGLSQLGYNRMQQAPGMWQRAQAMAGIPQGNYWDAMPLKPTWGYEETNKPHPGNADYYERNPGLIYRQQRPRYDFMEYRDHGGGDK